MPTAVFQKLDGLKYSSVQAVESNIVMDNQQGTLITNFLNKVGTFLNLNDESGSKKSFTPLQMHFHAPSEHTFNGRHYDLELHIVNANADITQLSVLGYMFDVKAGGSANNWFIDQVLNSGVDLRNVSKYNATTLDVKRFVDQVEQKNVYHYDGSLTTPGCAEIVEWIVIDNVQTISPAQLKQFTSKWADNY